ncbi:MAG TPA: MFS transporter [Acidimicrobiales bacterium]|nr:MFS transporter [Acidimicrobiales bacterium]
MRTQRWLGALAERDFRLYFVGQSTSAVGTGMLPVALSFAVLDRSGSAGQVGLVLGAETLPLVLLLLVAGVVADRTNRRAVMVGADLLRASSQSALALWLLLGRPPLWGFLVAEALVGTGTAFFTPAMTGLIPHVARPEHLQQANALNSLSRWSGALVGPALAGLLVAGPGAGWAVAVDAASYLVSAMCLLRLGGDWTRGAAGETFLAQLRDGWHAFRQRTWLWVVVTQFSFYGLPAFYVFGAVVAKRSLGGAIAWGAVLAAQGAGSVVAAVVMLRVQPRRPLLVGELVMFAWAALLAALAVRAPVAVVAVCAFAAGAAFGVFGPLWDTTMQRELPDEVLSRASAYDWFGSFALLPVGYGVVGFMARGLGIDGALWLGAIYLALTTAGVLLLPSVTGLQARLQPPDTVTVRPASSSG